MTIIIYEPLRKLIKNNALYYGGNKSFYDDTLISLTKYTQYSPVINNYTHIALNVFLFLFGIGLCFLIIKNIQNGFHLLSIENLLFVLLFLAILSSVLQHYLLGTLYLIDRTALFYYSLFILVLCFSFNLTYKIIQYLILSFVLFLSGLNFITNVNGYKTAIWYFDAHTETILTWLNEKGINQNKNITIDLVWLFRSVVYHFHNKKKYPFVKIINSSLKRNH